MTTPGARRAMERVTAAIKVCVCCLLSISIFSDLSSLISQRTANSVRHTRHVSREDGADARRRRAVARAEARRCRTYTVDVSPRVPLARGAACGESRSTDRGLCTLLPLTDLCMAAPAQRHVAVPADGRRVVAVAQLVARALGSRRPGRRLLAVHRHVREAEAHAPALRPKISRTTWPRPI